MCGINGVIAFHNSLSQSKLGDIVHEMNNRIIHRGPDSEGLYSDDICALGMRRLSIIDLSKGDQPIYNEDGSKLILFNGELYNYRALKRDLENRGHHFKTDSDTEVVLIGFDEYGAGFFKMMDGMFACCIYDLVRKKWILARDRIGEKPLYYYKDKNYLVFASELKSIMSTGLVKKTISMEAMSIFFQLTYIPAPFCIIEGVKKLEQGSYLEIESDGTMNESSYWKLELDKIEPIRDYEECKKKLKDALYESVEDRMISDVPLGAFLSGGFDSTIITGIMSDISDKRIDTFTIGFKEKQYDESDLAQKVAKRHNTNHHVLTLDWDSKVDKLDGILDNIDEPFADSSYIATYFASGLASEYVKVVLTGDAGDELFAGYDKYLISYYSNLYKKIPYAMRKAVIEPASSLLPKGSSIERKVKKVISVADMDIYEQRKRLMCLGLQAEEYDSVIKNGKASKLRFIKEIYDRYPDIQEQTRTQYTDLNIVLEGDMLAKVDRASMLASVETRVPMLSKNVIETAYSIPEEYKINRKNRKIILKDTFKELIPEELFTAPKHGFAVPIGKWLRTIFRAELLTYIEEEFLTEQNLFDVEAVKEMINQFLEGRKENVSAVWCYFVFQRWYKSIIE